MTRHGRWRGGSFWWLASTTGGLVALLLGAAWLAAARTLPCQWAFLRPIGMDMDPRMHCVASQWPFPLLQWIVPAVAVAILVATITAGIVTLLRTLRRTRRATRVLTAAAHPARHPRLVAAARTVGAGRLSEADDDAAWCFCIGLLRPRVVISRGFVEALGDDQLAAVLVHEAHHARRRDPALLLVARVLTAMGWLLPVVRDLLTATLLESELAADRAATATIGQTAVAGALRVALGSRPPAAVPVAFATETTVLARAACLAGRPLRTRRWRPARLGLTVTALAAAVAAVITIGPYLTLEDRPAAHPPAAPTTPAWQPARPSDYRPPPVERDAINRTG